MSGESELPTTSNAGDGVVWAEAWVASLAHPSVNTFRILANDPGASSRRAYGWIIRSALVGALIVYLSHTIGGNYSPEEAAFNLFGITFPTELVSALAAVFWFVVFVVPTHLLSRALGGSGTYSKLAFACAAFYAPISLISSATLLVDDVVPVLGALLTITISIYTCALTVIAVKAVHDLGWPRSIASSSVILLAQACYTLLWVSSLVDAVFLT